MLTKLLNFINYWLVPPNATEEERLHRIQDVGAAIGVIIGFVIFIISVIWYQIIEPHIYEKGIYFYGY